jgi:hypothetical protein
MTNLFLFLQLHGADILQALTSIVSGASVLANFTRTDRDNRAVGLLSKAVHFLAANFFAVRAQPPVVNQ